MMVHYPKELWDLVDKFDASTSEKEKEEIRRKIQEIKQKTVGNTIFCV